MSDKEKEEEKSEEEKVLAYKKAGKIAYEVFQEIESLIKPGSPVIEICNKSESLILENHKAEIAFPTNVSIDNIAAHYTSPANDTTLIPEKSVVKVDIGVHVEGFIADTARTFCFNPEFSELKKAAEEGFRAGYEIMRDGTSPRVIGSEIESTIKDFGFLPLRELSGHLLGEYELHGAKILPNISIPFDAAESALVDGEVYALETFASTGSGSIHEMSNKYFIYGLLPRRGSVRSRSSREIMRHIVHSRKSLPFAERWILEKFPPPRARFALRELMKAGILHAYNVLADTRGSYVAQYEDTILVQKDGAIITTQPPFDFMDEIDSETDDNSPKEE